MPSGKKTRALKTDEPSAAAEIDDPAIEEPAGDEVASDEPPVDEVVAEPVVETRRWKRLRRRKNEPTAVDAPEQAEDTEAAEPAASEPQEHTEVEASEAEPAVVETEVIFVPHRPAGKRLKIAAASAAALFVAGGAFLGATAQPVIANRALVETKLNIARTAADAITTLWSYTPENMDSLGERSARYLSGDFAFQYKKFIDSIVATNKQAQVTNTTSVLGTAVESVSANDASAIVYTNSTATSPVSKNIPSLRYLSYRLEMKRDNSDWRITRMTTITALDLTPQL